MTDMNPRAVIGGNAPPDPIDEISQPWESSRVEAENWTDGTVVENEAQMRAVDALRDDMRKFRLALEAGREKATAPLFAAYKKEGARWKPTVDDIKRIEGRLVALGEDFKRKEKAKREEAERLARAEASRKLREAEKAARQSNAADLEVQRAADAAKREADEAVARAKAATDAAASIKGLRNATRYEITDHKALLNWIALNRRADLTAFIEEWARKNHKPDPHAEGLRVWTEKEAF